MGGSWLSISFHPWPSRILLIGLCPTSQDLSLCDDVWGCSHYRIMRFITLISAGLPFFAMILQVCGVPCEFSGFDTLVSTKPAEVQDVKIRHMHLEYVALHI